MGNKKSKIFSEKKLKAKVLIFFKVRFIQEITYLLTSNLLNSFSLYQNIILQGQPRDLKFWETFFFRSFCSKTKMTFKSLYTPITMGSQFQSIIPQPKASLRVLNLFKIIALAHKRLKISKNLQGRSGHFLWWFRKCIVFRRDFFHCFISEQLKICIKSFYQFSITNQDSTLSKQKKNFLHILST